MTRPRDVNPWLEIFAAQLAAGRIAIDAMSSLISSRSEVEDNPPPPPRLEWATPYRTVRELPTMRLIEFVRAPPRPAAARPCTIAVAPYALHEPSVADFAPGHSLVETLLANSKAELFLTAWRSASVERRFDSIDTLLADLNVAVDDAGAGSPVALIGLCQGGWLAAAFAARFPAKVAGLALAGAPIDIAAEPSLLSNIAAATPGAAVDEILRAGGGLMRGAQLLEIWPTPEATRERMREIFQYEDRAPLQEIEALERRFRLWDAAPIDLPGVYFRQTVDWIFRENRLAAGGFLALGEEIKLKRIVCPLFLVVARDDEITSPGQTLALAKLVGTPPKRIETHLVNGRHLSLFMGKEVLTKAWPLAARFVERRQPQRGARASPGSRAAG
jgi:poly(3-hydroxyalkanoate) synthetase